MSRDSASKCGGGCVPDIPRSKKTVLGPRRADGMGKGVETGKNGLAGRPMAVSRGGGEGRVENPGDGV